MTNSTTLAVIYANENNIWDARINDFHYGKNFDETSYAITSEKATSMLEQINKQRLEQGLEEAYLVVT